jgi:hypothetical protein
MEASKEPSERRRKKSDEQSSITDSTQDGSSGQPALSAEQAGADEPLAQPNENAAETRADASVALEGEGTAFEEASDPGSQRSERRRIEEQLEALKRKESELRRALAIADHPALADAIRLLEGHAFALGRVEAKMAQGLSKAEERRRETLEKKVSGLREKRDELNAELALLEGELSQLGEQRTAGLNAERTQALGRLIETMNAHHGALRQAGLEAGQLVPEIAQWMPEVEALATKISAE